MSSTELPLFEYLPASLRVRVLSELLNPKYLRRTHSRRRTYDWGCRGPLCALASAQYDEGRRRQKAAAQNKPYLRRPGRRSLDSDTEALLIRAQNDYNRSREVISAQAS